MDGRDIIALSGSSSSYYLQRGVNVSGSHSNLQPQPVFRPATTSPNPNPNPNPNLNFPFQANVRDTNSDGSQFELQNTSLNFPHGLNMDVVVSSSSEPAKKKRGRPRKYGPDGTNVALGLSPMPGASQSGSITPTERKPRGRPRGSGWKQKLAPLGEWMNSSAGLAFTPHVIHVSVGEDIAAKIVEFSQQKPRGLCVLTGHGAVSAVTLRQLTSSAATVTYEGRFQILCLSGSYLVADSGARDRTGGISVSLCSADGHVIGGGVSELIAATPVQVVLFTFVYGGPKSKNKALAEPEAQEKKPLLLSGDDSTVTLAPRNSNPNQNLTPTSSAATWPILRPDMRNPQRDFDLTQG